MKVTATHEEVIRQIKEAELEITEITLLSVKEADSLLTKEQRFIGSWWWLRSPGRYPDRAAYVSSGGNISAYGNYVRSNYGVIRPALRFSNSNLVWGDSFEAGCEQWLVIDDGLALCESIVGKSPFRTDYNASDANDYEKSDVKKWLDNWALRRGLYTTTQLEQMQGNTELGYFPGRSV